jgi:hypothetical protein
MPLKASLRSAELDARRRVAIASLHSLEFEFGYLF